MSEISQKGWTKRPSTLPQRSAIRTWVLGTEWDSTGVAFKTHAWERILRVGKPGALLLAFSATQTYHRVASAIEDAGWGVRDSLQWLRGNGFPKNRDRAHRFDGALARLRNFAETGRRTRSSWRRKPLNGTYTHNAMKWGCGLLNLDACRIPCDGKAKFPEGKYVNPGIFGVGCSRDGGDSHPESRCPTNVIMDEEAAQLLDEQQAGASRFFYCGRATTREKNAALPPDMTNDHPCAKPLALCWYLATLILPPVRETPRRLLVPFCGMGSEIIGALLAGWDEVVGIEMEQNYIDIAEWRIRHWIAGQ